MKIVLLDFWSDRNRGDAAMQVAMLRIVREIKPSAYITIMTAYGHNQVPMAVTELDESAPLADDIVGGVGFTSIPLGNTVSGWRRKRGTAIALVRALLTVPLWLLASRSPAFDRCLSPELRRSIHALREADVVLWNGRNFRSDSKLREPYEVWTLLYNPSVALAFGKPMAGIGASVWPLRNRAAIALLKHIFSRLEFLSLREPQSYEYVRGLLGEDSSHCHLLPDLSLEVVPGEVEPVPPDREGKIEKLGITLVDWPNGGADARRRYAAALRDLAAKHLTGETGEVLIVPQVTYEAEETGALIAEVTRGLPTERLQVISGRPTISDLCEIYAGIDVLVATRMHSAIFALSCGTPAVTIPYDSGGKWGIVEMLSARDLSVPYVGVSAQLLTEKVEEAWSARRAIQEEVCKRLIELRPLVKANLSLPLDQIAGS